MQSIPLTKLLNYARLDLSTDISTTILSGDKPWPVALSKKGNVQIFEKDHFKES